MTPADPTAAAAAEAPVAVEAAMTTLRRPQRWFDGYVFDLDGTLYLGDCLLPGAAQTVATVRARGARIAFLTNKPLERPSAYAAKLRDLGIPAADDEVVSSTDALLRYLRETAPGARILPIAEPLIGQLLEEAGFPTVALDQPETADLVIVSWDRTFDYAKLVAAFRAVRNGARLVATNPDPFCPLPDGDLPDCAAMLAAIEACTGVRAEAVVGKPSVHMAATLLEHLALPADDTVVVGDRVLTDVRMAQEVGMASALVLTGATDPDALRRSAVTPDFVLASVADILPPGPSD